MKYLLTAASAGALLLLCGCVTRTHYVDLTGDIMVDGPRMIESGPPNDKVLWEDRTAVAEMRRGDFAQAKVYLDDVVTRLGGLAGPDKEAAKARGYFHEESEKPFVGEPYERVMAYYYRGIIYWMDGEPDNARACFRAGELEDSSYEGQSYQADYVLLDYLDGLVTTKSSGDGSDALKRAEKEARMQKPPVYDPNANVLFFIDFGPGPRKYAAGRYREQLHFDVPYSQLRSAAVKVDDQTLAAGPYDDLGFQATTRGGRVMDYVLANKAVFKAGTQTAGNVGILAGAVAATSRDHTAQDVGLGLIAAGVIADIVSANATPNADTRAWSNLPRYLGFATAKLSPGSHQVIVEFRDGAGNTIPRFTKTLTVTVPDNNKDKVVFVSDQSASPQSQ